ncbi:hypothetical protein HYV86_01745 [Candidatus Woesearchaeota archaeon]|nr:hypothetical protein [Candidatus Woesearchaeota archaeon]
MTSSLGGIVVKAELYHRHNRLPVMNVDGEAIPVYNAQRYVGSEILARVKFRSPLVGNFICSASFADAGGNCFSNLRSEQYVLVGLWEADMQKAERYPTHKEVEQYFEPGEMQWLLYIKQDNQEDDRGRTVSLKNHSRFLRGTWRKMIRDYLPDAQRAARVVIAETMADVEKCRNAARDLGLESIMMEPKKS